MYARVVRFTDATREAVDAIKERVEESGGPPPGVDASAMKMMFDSEQRTAVFVAFFDTAEAMAGAEEVLANMDAGETPGTRASIDRCEVVIERDV